ncbi:phenoloxidase-activating factor 3-like isoform X2 [Rhynchophorus ferrugineus]|uniref:phenoloxidase-activating factor 3-like isoform X2 n=1 Tax=Rhynchophorus ferrugineus TaxID=354439 RepID=UPI003FCCACC6
MVSHRPVLARLAFLLLLLSACSDTQWVNKDEYNNCQTPDQQQGICKNIATCSPMVTVLRKASEVYKGRVPASVAAKLQAYTCGSDSIGSKVCCPFGPINLDLGVTVSNPSTPPDISRHQNLKLLPEDCGYLDTENRIVNGEDAYLNEFPWMALLGYKSISGTGQISFSCGGSIINKNYILTAAHCIANLGKKQLVTVRVGEHSIKNSTDCEIQPNKKLKCNPPVQDLRVEEIIPHPYFNKTTLTNDIGLIRVSNINLNLESTRPVCLPITEDRKNVALNRVIVTGWGVTNPESRVSSDILQKIRLPVVSRADCQKIYQPHGVVLHDYQLCAGGLKNKDSCSGDSGGPLVVPVANEFGDAQYIQQAVVSFGPKYCGLENYAGVYTLIKFYMDWILNTMKN